MSIKRNAAILALFLSASVSAAEQRLVVLKDPNCGCCENWLNALPENFSIAVRHPQDLPQIKQKLGIRANIQSCHTAVSDTGVFFEGHVPPALVSRYLEERKPGDGVGLTVPGMPVGSVGMEMGERFQPYTVYEVKTDGSVIPYKKVSSLKQQSALSNAAHH